LSRLIILGSGTSFGVPVIGCTCEVCRSDDPRDRRRRTAAVIEVGTKRVLIDTPPELRLQLVDAEIDRVDAVLFTHDHADHVAGIDDLRAMSVRGRRVPVFGPAETLATLRQRFGYIFDRDVVLPRGTTKPELELTALEPYQETEIEGLHVVPLEVEHGDTRVFGYRVGAVAYVTDAKRLPSESLEQLRGLEVLVLNALFDQPHPTHLSIPEAVALATDLGARRTLLTHLTHRYSHMSLLQRLPAGIEPASDGLVVEF